MWAKFLNENYCQVNPLTENRLCDDGSGCTKCHYQSARNDYEVWLTKQKPVKESIKEEDWF